VFTVFAIGVNSVNSVDSDNPPRYLARAAMARRTC